MSITTETTVPNRPPSSGAVVPILHSIPASSSAPPTLERRGPDADLAVRVLTWVVLSAVVTSFSVQFSFRHGRLMYRPSLDDVNYFNDGLAKLKAFDNRGFSQVLYRFRQAPPHSPFSTLMAMGAFALLGKHDWAPYAADGLLVFLTLGVVDWLMPAAAAGWQRLLACAMVASVRLIPSMVVEFRPDVPWGVMTAGAVLFTLRRPLLRSGIGHRLAVGAFFGAALLIKPSISPMTLALFGLSLVLAVYCDEGLRLPPVKSVALAWGVCLAAAAVVAAPYYAIAWRETADYIYANVLGSAKQYWVIAGTPLQLARYYVDGDGGQFSFGQHLWPLLALIAVGVPVIWRDGDPERRRRIVAAGVATLAAYAVPTISKMKSNFFGVGFEALVVLGAAMCFGRLVVRPTGGGRRFPVPAFAVAAAVTFVLLFQGPLNQGNVNDPLVRSRRLLTDEIYGLLKRQAGDSPGSVLFTTTGFGLNGATMTYLATVDGLDLKFEVAFDQDEDQVIAYAARADYVVAGETGNSESLDFLPTSIHQDQALAWLRANSNFARLASFPTLNGKVYEVYARRDRGFGGFDPIGGLDAPVGPFPQRGLPVIRYGIGPQTRLRLAEESAGRRTLVIDVAAHVKGQAMTILIDGKEIGRHVFPPVPAGGPPFERLDYTIDLSAGPHELAFKYDRWDDSPSDPVAVTFRVLRVTSQGAVGRG